MCLAVPAKILTVSSTQALCEMTGITKTIDISLTPDVLPGQWVIVHVGFSLQVIDEEQAVRTLALMQTLASAADAGGTP